jgi:LytTr DNA-binding domain
MATAVSGCGELFTSHKFLRSGASKNQRDSRHYRKRAKSDTPIPIFVVRARTSEGTVWVNYQLGDLEQGLSEFSFFRAHRASLVNLRRVKEIRPAAGSAFMLIMDDAVSTQIEVSERQARTLRVIIPGL